MQNYTEEIDTATGLLIQAFSLFTVNGELYESYSVSRNFDDENAATLNFPISLNITLFLFFSLILGLIIASANYLIKRRK